MSLLNLIVSAALSISPNELSDLQKAAGTKHTEHRDKRSSSVAAEPSASTFQHPIASSKADTRSSAEEQERKMRKICQANDYVALTKIERKSAYPQQLETGYDGANPVRVAKETGNHMSL
ncbi:uncharacterized protein RCO7_05002 [Rhynchosporium graminicola]|uniref:Uncharacterized protein n=1 Tax=Rhynchosporium graminicola TaxID=2792576 RepID=A0A1E1KDX9_9HELO|nr:uncharacterized protein RCO7_05002 [Rhynchosporium commune]